MNSLGIKASDTFYGTPVASFGSKKEKERMVFPSVTFDNAQVEALGAGDCDPGEKLKCVVELTVRRVSKEPGANGKMRTSVGFDITACEPAEKIEGGDESSGDGESEESEVSEKESVEEKPAYEAQSRVVRGYKDGKRSSMSPKDAGLSD